MTRDLFSNGEGPQTPAPLADRMRPRTLGEVVGQEHITGVGTMLRGAVENGQIPSLIFWGPPGCGKTTLARVIANSTKSHFVAFSAVLAGVKEVRKIVDEAGIRIRRGGERTILFLDEIHRFNKSQQDSFLPHVEAGTIILIGATTENPSFEVNAALLSRCRILTLKPLEKDHLLEIINRTLADEERGLGKRPLRILDQAAAHIIKNADGDARRVLNTLEVISSFDLMMEDGAYDVRLADVEQAVQSKAIIYDKAGEQHYNVISAFIKSVRGSDPDAALYYLARMFEAGEDPMFIARRMVILASEDIGNADLRALPLAVSAMDAVHMIGMPEARIILAHAVSFLACAPKSNASYAALKAAERDVKEHGALQVPMHIRNAPTRLMKDLGYSKGYKNDHDQDNHHAAQQFLPDEIADAKYYHPSDQGNEERIKARLEWLRARKK